MLFVIILKACFVNGVSFSGSVSVDNQMMFLMFLLISEMRQKFYQAFRLKLDCSLLSVDGKILQNNGELIIINLKVDQKIFETEFINLLYFRVILDKVL